MSRTQRQTAMHRSHIAAAHAPETFDLSEYREHEFAMLDAMSDEAPAKLDVFRALSDIANGCASLPNVTMKVKS